MKPEIARSIAKNYDAAGEKALGNVLRELTDQAETAEQRFLRAMKAITQIEDLLEYSYKHYTCQELRDEIMSHVGNLSRDLAKGATK